MNIVEDAVAIGDVLYVQFSDFNNDSTFIVEEEDQEAAYDVPLNVIMSVSSSGDAYLGPLDTRAKERFGKFRFAPHCKRDYWNFYDNEGKLLFEGKTNRLQKFELRVFEQLMNQGFFDKKEESSADASTQISGMSSPVLYKDM